MTELKITRAELVDVALGNCDPLLEAKVRQAMSTDPRLAEWGRQWPPIINRVQAETVSTRAMAERISRGVMKRLPQMKQEEALYFLEDEERRPGFLSHYFGPVFSPLQSRDSLSLGGVLAVLTALIMLFISLVAVSSYQMGLMKSSPIAQSVEPVKEESDTATEPADGVSMTEKGRMALLQRDNSAWIATSLSGKAFVSSGAMEDKILPIKVNEAIRFPAMLDLARDAVAHLNLPDQSEINLIGPCSLYLRNSRDVGLISGMAGFRILNQSPDLAQFRVQIPQGQVVDLGTEFSVSLISPESSRVVVFSGKVRVTPLQGEAVDLTSGAVALCLSDQVIALP